MTDILKKGEQHIQMLNTVATKGDRRSFLKFAGMSIALLTISTGCNDDDTGSNPNNTGVNLGSGDIGVLNYAYALEQLEAAFYIKVLTSPYTGMSASETTILTEIRNHEIAHRDFFSSAIPSASRIPSLEVDFSSIDFTQRDKVLAAAKTFENLGVAAYNGAGKLLENSAYLLLAGKIVSVEARHAAVISDLIAPKTAAFASDMEVDPTTGLDKAMTPAQVLSQAGMYIKTSINAGNLPIS